MVKLKGHGRFGSRYGKKIRDKIILIARKERKRYYCPRCSRTRVRRIAAGIWECEWCGTKYASRAYEFVPPEVVE